MARKTSKKSAKVAEKADGKPVAAKAAKPRKAVAKSSARKPAKATILAGVNPQIAKADGDAPVQAYIARRSPGRSSEAALFEGPMLRPIKPAALWVKGYLDRV